MPYKDFERGEHLSRLDVGSTPKIIFLDRLKPFFQGADVTARNIERHVRFTVR